MSQQRISPQHQQLREVTAQAHAQVDALFASGLSSATDVRRYLLGMHRLCADVLRAWQRVDAKRVPAAALQRCQWLEQDLNAAGLTPLPDTAQLALTDQHALLGAEYVIEGSHYGARLLLKQAQAAGTPEACLHFLRAHGNSSGNAQGWPGVLQQLADISDANALHRVQTGALLVFAAAASAFAHPHSLEHASTCP